MLLDGSCKKSNKLSRFLRKKRQAISKIKKIGKSLFIFRDFQQNVLMLLKLCFGRQ